MIPEHIQQVLEEHRLEPLVFEEGSTPTVETAAARIGVEPGRIAKSILMRGKDGRFRMFVTAGDKKISSSMAKQITGVKLSMASAEQTKSVTGCAPGAVCPFGISGIDIYIDESIREYDVVYPAAGTDASGVPVTFAQLLEITCGTPCRVTV